VKEQANLKKINKESERYYVQKMTKELIKTWSNLDKEDQEAAQNETLNFLMVKKML
jgi:hypothetical protein